MEQVKSEAYNCDCLEYMRKLPDNYFDLAIADPPYGIGASRPSKKAERARQPDGSILQVPVTDFTKKDWDNTIPSQEFFDELRRVSRNQIIWGANYFGLQGGMIVWDKINGNSDQYDCEIAYQSFNKRTDLVHYMWNGMFQGKYCGRDIRQAVVQQGNKTLNEKRIHPTQKPVILYEWLLNNYAKKGDRIFDPMMGSQSSRIAAYRLGFDYVGCELDKEYYDKGCARFDSEWTKIDRNLANLTDMTDIKDNKPDIRDRMALLQQIREKLHELLPKIGHEIFFNEGFDISFNGMNRGFGDEKGLAKKLYHSNWIAMLKDRFGDRFVCGTTNGGIEIGDMTTGDLQQLNKKLDDLAEDIAREKDLIGRYQAAGMGNGTQFWPDSGALGAYKAFSFKDNNILVFKDADSKGVRLSSLPHEEQKRIMETIGTLLDRHITSKELADAKAKLVKVLDSARADLGDTILIQPTTVKLAGIDTTVKAIFLAPDSKGGGEFRLAGEDYAVLAVGEGKYTEFNIEKILDAVASINGLAKAVHEAHVNHLEQVAKQAIHDRIVTPSARRFTPEQVEVLNRYHQVAVPDKPAGEVFKDLLYEVTQELDVARKPEKWINDTAKELNDLADGITREQGQGLKR